MTKLNPKDYPDFEAYTRALKMRKEFEEKSKLVSMTIANSETDAEFKENMEKLGFTYHEDEFCGREFCSKHEICLSILLDEVESGANEHVFLGLLSDCDLILPKRTKGSPFLHCDDLPEVWFEKDSAENKAIESYLAIEDLISNFGSELRMSYYDVIKNKPELRKLLEALYFWLHSVLKDFPKQTTENYKEKILGGLEEGMLDMRTKEKIRSILTKIHL